MCIKTIYHNTYADGARDVTERVETCTPGFLCAHPRIRDVDRTVNRPKYSSSGRASPAALAPPAPYYASDVRPVSPITPPGSRGSDGSDRRRRKSLYLDGNKIVEVRHERSPRRYREREPRNPVVLEPKPPASPSRRVPFAPEPPAPRTLPMPIPIAMKRASTMPYGTGLETPPERGRRPIIVEEPAPRTPRRRISDAVPVGPVEVLEHASSGRRRQTRRDSELLHPHSRRHERSPQGYGSAEDDAERRARRRRRRDARADAAGMATSVPTFGNTNVYSSSYDSTHYSSSGASSPVVVEASPAVTAVKKHLRWEDQQRAEQNNRIRSRPKLARAATATGAGVAVSTTQAEVKSILKNPSGGTSPVVGPKVADDQLAELYRSVEGMSLSQNEQAAREAGAERRARAAEAQDSAAYIDRLRGRFDAERFSMPPRRFTAGSGNRRRTEIWYPDEGRYKYL